MNARQRASRAALAIVPGVLLAGFAGGIAFPILPAVGLRTGMPLLLIGAILAANRVGRIVFSPFIGAAADRLGARTLLVGGLLTQLGVMGLYYLGVTTEHPALFFLLGRLLQGPGSACVFISAQTLALQSGGSEHGGLAAGTVKAAMSIGLPLGVLAGGLLSSRLGEAATFQASMFALGLATLTALLAVSPAPREPAARFSFSALITTLANRRLAALGALNFAVTFSALGVVLTTLSLVVGPTAGLLMGWMVVAMGVSTLLSSRLVRTARAHAKVCVVATASLAPAMIVIGLSTEVPGYVLGLTLLGAAAGSLSSSVVSLLSDTVGARHVGAGTGWIQLCGDLGGVLGPITGASLLAVSARAAYFSSALLLAAFIPIAIWLLSRVPSPAEPGRSCSPRSLASRTPSPTCRST